MGAVMAHIALAAIPLALAVTTPATTPTTVDVPATNPWRTVTADWNNDGQLDVLVINHRDGYDTKPDWHDMLIVADGDEWRVELELPYADRHGCTALDANNDDRLDFFCAVGSSQTDHNDGLGPNELWLQTDDGWTEAAQAWGIDDPANRGRFVAVVDWNRDGRDDLFVGVAPRSDMDVHAAIWFNRGTHFVPRTVKYWGTACAVPWGDGVVVCDVGGRLGKNTWWLRPGRAPVLIGHYNYAVATVGRLALFADAYVQIGGRRLNLPRGDITPASINANNLYVPTASCLADVPTDKPDMVYQFAANAWSDAPNDPGCTSAVAHLDGDRVLLWERSMDGTPLGARVGRIEGGDR